MPVCNVQAAAELAWQKERAGLQEARAAAQRRSQDLERVNAELQVHLDRSAHAAAGQTPNQGTGVISCVDDFVNNLL